jgi:3-hydroxy-9,10-secoandrosta-1,3,5(10)-triene-9,17-dione monooxygenase
MRATSDNRVSIDSNASRETLIARAIGLRDQLRSEQDQAAALGRYTDAMHAAMLDAGLYHVLTPRRYGGYEYDVRTFMKIALEISRGDPGSGWCYCLGHGHVLTTAALFPGEVQDQLFNNPRGYFRASHSLRPSGTARKVTAGYVINAVSRFQSGVPYSSHATVCVTLDGSGGDGQMPRFLQVIVPEAQYTILDDWGHDISLGMRASGSNSVKVENQLVPEGYAVELDWLGETERSTSVGAEFHANSLYLGVAQTFLQAELVACMTGAARAALDEYESACRQKPAAFPPFSLRLEDPGYQHDFGSAKMKTDSAEHLLMHVCDLYRQYSEAAFRGNQPFTRALDVENYGMLTQAGELAFQAVVELYRSSGASAAMNAAKMERYYRDASMAISHNSFQYDALARRIGMYNFGRVNSIF